MRSGEDAATGFLITASVLLPGQIGEERRPKRLARQDALDEIVNQHRRRLSSASASAARAATITSSIRSRSAITTRCRPSSPGVEYGDRELHTPEAEARKKAEEPLRQRSPR